MPNSPCSPRGRWLRGAGIRLAQIVGNLLNNAAKFTPAGGAIALTAQQQDDAVVIRVKDNGIGIAPDSIASIFEMFAQTEHAPDRVQDGFGIGLSFVKSLVGLRRQRQRKQRRHRPWQRV